MPTAAELTRLVECYRGLGQPEKAAPWEQKLETVLKAEVEAKLAASDAKPAGAREAAASLRSRAGVYKQLGRFAEALADEERSVGLDPVPNRQSSEDAAALHLYLGHEQEYLAARRALISEFAGAYGDHPAKTCLLRPLDGEQAKAVMGMLDRALSSGADAETLQFFRSAKAMAEYRGGNYGEAIKWLELGRSELTQLISNRDSERRFQAWDEVRATYDFFLAMSQHGLGRFTEANATLALAEQELRTSIPSATSGSGRLKTTDWLMAQIVAREAEATIHGDGPTTRPSTNPSTMPAIPSASQAASGVPATSASE
jgi:tetratricopeptide (TPR) repeat protein